MRIESSVVSLSWVPSGAVEGIPKLPFELGLASYDDPPPDAIDDLDSLHAAGAFRLANELRGWIEVEDGRIVDHGHEGRALVCPPRARLGRRSFVVPMPQFPLLRPDPEVGDGAVRFVQTAGARLGPPVPRRVLERPYVMVSSPPVWTTLELVVGADGDTRASLKGASPFPRHWVYDGAGRLFAKSATIDFEGWYRETGGERMPWRGRDAEPLAAEVESALERRLAGTVMRIESVRRLDLDAGETLTEQGARGTDVFLLLDGVLAVEVDEAVVAELGPGSIVGERAALEDGRRTATLRATTPCRAVVVPLDVLDEGDLGELAATRRRGDGS